MEQSTLSPTVCIVSGFSRVWLFAILWAEACQAPLSMNSSGENTGVNCHALLRGIFQTQGSNPSLFCLMRWQAGSLPLVPTVTQHQILRVTYLSTSMSKIQMSGGVLRVLLKWFGESMQWKIKDAPNHLAISSNCEIVVKNPRIHRLC